MQLGSDYEHVKKLYADVNVRKYLGGIIPEIHALNKFMETLDRANRHQSFYWAVTLKENNTFIGLVSLENHRDGLHMEVSYEFSPNNWGHGYAEEVIRRLILYAFKELNQSKLIAEIQSANLSSCRLLEKVGMKAEQTLYRYGAEQVITAYRTDR
ncbi:GNAT family N-acetyltransferase [Paenibacillus sp. LPE1-1-1.1]